MGTPQKMEANQFPSLLYILTPYAMMPYIPARILWLITNLLCTGVIIGLLRNTFMSRVDERLYPVFMMLMLAGRLRALYTMKKMYEKGMSEADIAMRLSQKPYAVKKGLESTRSLSAKKLLDYLNQLAELDQGIKSGQIDPKDGFEQFVLRNGKRYAGY